MSKTLTASNRKTLIRFASTLPKGSEERKAILAGLDKTASDGQEFADLLSKKWRKVKWDERRNQGSASLGHFKISWFESGNDTAVIVNIDSMDRLKGSPENVMDALEYLNKTWMKV